jgi:hypothetical protein
MSSFNKENNKVFRSRNVAPTPSKKLVRVWIAKDYDNGGIVRGRVELRNDMFVAIKTPEDVVVGQYPTLSAARQSLLVKRAK